MPQDSFAKYPLNSKEADIELKKRAKFLIKQSGILKYIKKGSIYADIGAGLGHLAEYIYNKYKNIEVNVVEPVGGISKFVKSRINKSNGRNFKFYKASAEKLPFKDNYIDVISLIYVLHHVEDNKKDKVIKEIKRVLKEDGFIIIVEDTPETKDEYERNLAWDKRLNREMKFEEDHGIHEYKDIKTWRDFFIKKGFKIIKAKKFFSKSSVKEEGKIKHTVFVLQK